MLLNDHPGSRLHQQEGRQHLPRRPPPHFGGKSIGREYLWSIGRQDTAGGDPSGGIVQPYGSFIRPSIAFGRESFRDAVWYTQASWCCMCTVFHAFLMFYQRRSKRNTVSHLSTVVQNHVTWLSVLSSATEIYLRKTGMNVFCHVTPLRAAHWPPVTCKRSDCTMLHGKSRKFPIHPELQGLQFTFTFDKNANSL